MHFILKMAWRDSRASRRRLLLVSLSVVMGIAALVGIGSVGDDLRRAISEQTRSLLGADLAVTSRQPFTVATLARLTRDTEAIAQEVSVTSMVNFPTRGDQRRLVQVRGLDGEFPFYGEMVTEPAGAMAALADGNSALLEETILVQFGVQVGDPVVIGNARFTVAGALRKIPGESAAVSMFSPRVYLSSEAMAKTGLLEREGIRSYRAHLKLRSGVDADEAAEALKRDLAGERLNFTTVEDRKRDLGASMGDVESFLSLVGFISLFLGAVGVASGMHVYVRQKLATVAVLRCLGASARTSFSVYIVQGIAIGLIGAVLGAGLGIAVEQVLPRLLRDFLPFAFEVSLSWRAVVQGMAAGLIISILFALLPLLAVRRVSPLLALRSAQGVKVAPDRLRWWIYLGISAAVLGFAVLEAGKRRGLGFTVVLALSFAVFWAVAKFVTWMTRRFAPGRRWPYVLRQGLANLHRPNNRTVLLVTSLGLGVFLMLTLVLTRETLLGKISSIATGDRPNLMFFDIQEDQMSDFRRIVANSGSPLIADAPIVTMRLTRVRGIDVDILLRNGGAGIPGWTLRREYRSTYRATLSDTEKVVGGEFVSAVEPEAERIPISLEQGLARDLQVGLGDELVFSVQGVPLTTYVSSLRQVEWQRMQPNFFVVFPSGVLEAAPQTFVAAVRASSSEASAKLQQAIGRELPTVSAIDLALIMRTIDDILGKVSYVVSFIAAFTVATGVLVLAGAVLSGRFQRIRETVLLRTLGATRRQLWQIQLVEYAVLGFLAALAGGGLALGANALLAHFVFKTSPVFPVVTVVCAIVSAMGITLLVGLLANRSVTRHPPLEVLRQEV